MKASNTGGVSTMKDFEALDRALVAKGFPPSSPWWRRTLARFYESDRRQLVLRVGRRGGKSSTLARVAVVEALSGQHRIPPGDVGYVAFLSTTREEAGQRLRTIRAILDALNVRYRSAGEACLEFLERPIGFRVLTATIGGVSGFTCIAAIADEVAKWRDAETGMNPATEVLASLRPTLATQPRARIFLSSSPFGREDAHANAFDEGDTAFQLTAHAETWVANPSVSEATTRGLEPDERVWRREYAAIPSATTGAAFDADLVDRALRAGESTEPLEAVSRAEMVLDSSSGRGDRFTWAAVQWVRRRSEERPYVYLHGLEGGGSALSSEIADDDPRVRTPWATPARDSRGEIIHNPSYRELGHLSLRISNVGCVEGEFAETMSFEDVTALVSRAARPCYARKVYGDQYQRFALEAGMRRHGLTYCALDWTQATKPLAVTRLRQLLREGTLILDAGEFRDRMRREFLLFEERILAT
jgi:hypothetical protein